MAWRSASCWLDSFWVYRDIIMITTQSRGPDLTITGMVISSGKAPACKTHSSQINRTQCENGIYSMSYVLLWTSTCAFLQTHRDVCVGREAQGDIRQGGRGVEIQRTQCPISTQRLMERSQLQTDRRTDRLVSLGFLLCEMLAVVERVVCRFIQVAILPTVLISLTESSFQ